MNTQLIDTFIQEYADFKAQFAKKGQERLKEIINEFWAANPAVNVITWTQYTPYFMDGDPCEFSVNEPTFSNATEEDDISALGWGEYDGETEGVWAATDWNVERELKDVEGLNAESIKQFGRFIQSEAMADVLKTILGEDVKVVVTREGITATDYSSSHD